MRYEQALTATREAPSILPAFDVIADAAALDRTERLREADDARVAARRWLLVAAASWLLLPLDSLLIVAPTHVTLAALFIALTVVPPAAISLWGAQVLARTRSGQRQPLRAAILVRAVAASNLMVALLYALSIGGMVGALFTSLLAVASARTIQRLGPHGLDPSDDPTTPFTPVRFRGVLIVALVLAFADALTLLFSSSVAAVQLLDFALGGDASIGMVAKLVVTLLATLVMLANVHGLLRLRTWALASNIVCNVGIAGLAVTGVLATNLFVGLGLTVTAGIQLLAVVPILASALGDRHAGRSHEHLAGLVRWVVPILAVATIVIAALNFGVGTPYNWAFPLWP